MATITHSPYIINFTDRRLMEGCGYGYGV